MAQEPRILLLGAGGQVGRELQASFAGFGSLTATDRRSADLAVPEQLRELVRRVRPRVILNAAAYTAVDRAEFEADLAMKINAHAPAVLAEEASRCNALLVHYSTDYVFDGAKDAPWVETDTPNPVNQYGASKLAGERAIAAIGGRYLIFRTSWVYGPHGRNFLLTMLRVAHERDKITVVDDQFGAPTTSMEIAAATRRVVESVLAERVQDWSGIYHMTCSGATTWFGFARAIFARAGGLLRGRHPELTPITSAEYPTPARRPRNSVLSNEKLQARFGVRPASWESALDAVMNALRSEAGEARAEQNTF